MRPLMDRVQTRRGLSSVYPDCLTYREAEVVRLVADGKTDREIAEVLVIGVRTVSTHNSNILNKINAANRVEPSTYAARQGLV